MDVRLCRAKCRALAPALTERARRLWAATEARAIGRGGIAGVARATGIGYSTITRGLKGLTRRPAGPAERVRRPGGGRKRAVAKDPTLPEGSRGLGGTVGVGRPHVAAALDVEECS